MREIATLSLFQPDSLAAAQFEATMRPRGVVEPEQKLMLSVLEDAVLCFQKNLFAHAKNRRELFLETERWIFEEKSARLFAFENICHALGLNSNYIRRGLKHWRNARIKAHAEAGSASPAFPIERRRRRSLSSRPRSTASSQTRPRY